MGGLETGIWQESSAIPANREGRTGATEMQSFTLWDFGPSTYSSTFTEHNQSEGYISQALYTEVPMFGFLFMSCQIMELNRKVESLLLDCFYFYNWVFVF